MDTSGTAGILRVPAVACCQLHCFLVLYIPTQGGTVSSPVPQRLLCASSFLKGQVLTSKNNNHMTYECYQARSMCIAHAV